MTLLKAHFDGRVLVPDEPVDLPTGTPLELQIHAPAPPPAVPQKSLAALVALARAHPLKSNTPTDLAAEHDHYLHGTAKRA